MQIAGDKLQPTASAPDPDAPVRRALCQALREALRERGTKRPQVAERMTELLGGHRVTVDMLNRWASEAYDRLKFPLCYLDALSEATGSEALRSFCLSERQRRLIRLGENAESILLNRRKSA